MLHAAYKISLLRLSPCSRLDRGRGQRGGAVNGDGRATGCRRLGASMRDQVIAAASAASPGGVRWKILFLMLFLVSVNYIDRASLSVAMPLISKEFSIDPAWQGLILSSFFWTYAFMQGPGGMLAVRFNPRIVIALSTIGWGFFQTIAAVLTTWPMLLLTRLGLGMTEAPIYPAGGK